MLPILALATLAIANPAPITVQFTSDSVYKNESIIQPKEVIEQDNGLYTIVLEEDKLLGYCIADDAQTDHIDGLRFDEYYVYNYTVKDVDLNVEHVLLVKTVYTDDVAGMLAAAKDGDWSRALSNPLILFQLFYYILAALSIILGGFGLFKSKKNKAKDHNQIAAAIEEKSAATQLALEAKANDILEGLINPLTAKLKNQNQNIIKALVLAQSDDPTSKIALVNLLKDTASENISDVTSTIEKSITDKEVLKEQAKKEASKIIEDIAKDKLPDVRF